MFLGFCPRVEQEPPSLCGARHGQLCQHHPCFYGISSFLLVLAALLWLLLQAPSIRWFLDFSDLLLISLLCFLAPVTAVFLFAGLRRAQGGGYSALNAFPFLSAGMDHKSPHSPAQEPLGEHPAVWGEGRGALLCETPQPEPAVPQPRVVLPEDAPAGCSRRRQGRARLLRWMLIHAAA